MGKKEEKRPSKQNKLLAALLRALVFPRYLRRRNLSVARIGTENLKPPFLLLPSRGGPLDYIVAMRALSPHPLHFVLPSDLVHSAEVPLAAGMGIIIAKRHFRDADTMRKLKICVGEYRDAVAFFPEGRRTVDGTGAYFNGDAARFAKELGVPVAVLRMNGNYLSCPPWNGQDSKVPLYAELVSVADEEEIKTLSAEELHARICERIKTDDYAYQRAHAYEVNGAHRADGLHRILYQCPHCHAEFMTYSEDTRLWCASCGRGWQLSEFGELLAEEGETPFSAVPEWTQWERQNLRKKIESGDYSFGMEVFVRTSLGGRRFSRKRKGILTQTKEGTALEFPDTKERIEWKNDELWGLHIEYDYRRSKSSKSWGDVADLPKGDARYYVVFTERDRLTKFAFATDEIYQLSLQAARN